MSDGGIMLTVAQATKLRHEILSAIDFGLLPQPSANNMNKLHSEIIPLFGPNHLTQEQSREWLRLYELAFGREFNTNTEVW